MSNMLKFSVRREYVEAIVGVILRVPALFILEVWYKSDPENATQDTTKDMKLIAHAAYYLAVIFAVIIGTLPLRKLVMLYMYIVSGGVLLGSYYLSEMYVEVEQASDAAVNDTLLSALKDYGVTKRLIIHLGAQCLLASVISYLIDLQDWNKYIPLIFTAPIVARISGLPARDLYAVHHFSTIFSTIMVMFFAFNNLSQALDVLRDGVYQAREAGREFGWIPVMLTFWHAILLPFQLLLFWVLLYSIQLYIFYNSSNPILQSEGLLLMSLAAMGECCATPVSLFALCTVISYSSFFVLTLTKLFLLGWDGLVQDNDLLRGWTEGFTMLLIAIQTGLLDLKPLQRAFLMCILLFIVVSSLIQSMYEITDPILLSLSASHSKSIFKHARALVLCFCLWMFPLYMTFTICQYFDLDFWLMIIISSCLLTSVQVIGSLFIYWLFLYDAYRTESWEKLDDVVYYIRSTVRVLEFVVAVFVVCYGILESFAGEWSWINSLILLVHCYFNVWQRLQTGWKTFLLRREAVQKLESLPEASREQLADHNDVCAICFQDMKTARITKCGHYFHGCCLRKWLYVKDACPLCHQPINEKASSEGPSQPSNNGDVDTPNPVPQANNTANRDDDPDDDFIGDSDDYSDVDDDEYADDDDSDNESD